MLSLALGCQEDRGVTSKENDPWSAYRVGGSGALCKPHAGESGLRDGGKLNNPVGWIVPSLSVEVNDPWGAWKVGFKIISPFGTGWVG